MLRNFKEKFTYQILYSTGYPVSGFSQGIRPMSGPPVIQILPRIPFSEGGAPGKCVFVFQFVGKGNYICKVMGTGCTESTVLRLHI